jgi:hypothetical protein
MSNKVARLALAIALLAGRTFCGVAAGQTPGPAPSSAAVLPAADLEFLHDLTRDVVEESRVPPGKRVADSPTNTCGFTLIMPGGKGGYPAFWVRDFSMSLESGFITPREMLDHLRLMAKCQNGPEARRLQHGLVAPPFAVPDHINFDGGAVFYPGTYSSGDDQGTGRYGILPPVDNQYEFALSERGLLAHAHRLAHCRAPAPRTSPRNSSLRRLHPPSPRQRLSLAAKDRGTVGVFRPQRLCPKRRLYDLRDPPVGHSAITQMKPCQQESCGNLGGRSGERKDRKGVSGCRHRQANGMAEA